MTEFLSKIFDSSFMAHGHCFLWLPDLIWLHVGSDALITLSYYSIPLALLYIIKKRGDLVFDWMFGLFAAFIFLCGTTHLMAIWVIWHGTYRLEGVIKLLTAVTSFSTAVLLWRLIPSILSIPSRQTLEEEVARTHAAQRELEAIRDQLEVRIRERTMSLEESTAKLKEMGRIIDSSKDAILSRTLDGTVKSWNRAAEEIFGFSAQEMIGNSIRTLWGAEDHSRWLDDINHRLLAGETLTDIEINRTRKDGTQIALSITFSLMRGRDGQPSGVSVIARDIRERKKLEERFRTAVEAAPNVMLLVDRKGKILLANKQITDIFGYQEEEIIGKSIDMLVPQENKEKHIQGREGFFRSPKTQFLGRDRELFGIRKDMTKVPIEVGLTPIETSEGLVAICAIIDLTARNEAQGNLLRMLRQKEILLKEIHHRVKNNLQVISSLLKLQSGYIDDPKATRMFEESHERVRAMAIVHEKLYRSEEPDRVNFKEYIEELSSELKATYSVDSCPVALELDIGDIELNIEKAIPCALILNELVSNALKHAFGPDTANATIKISFHAVAEGSKQVELVIEDNGKGMPANCDSQAPKTMGLTVVHTLCEQLMGKQEVISNGGTKFRIVFSTENTAAKQKRSDYYGSHQNTAM
jgi:PAS domain S-box-containing protein